MSAPLLYLFFSGLVVFVPDVSNNLTAYAVDDGVQSSSFCNHVAFFVVHGAATLKQGPGALCDDSVSGIITCKLGSDTKVNIETENSVSPLPPKPPGGPHIYMPSNNSKENGGNIGWLVRLANVSWEAGTAISKPPSEAKMLSDGEFSFGWQQAYTCLFDEGGEKKVSPMAFIGNRTIAPHAQAVAEVVMFEAMLRSSTSIQVSQGSSTARIDMDCASGVCPFLEFSNNVDTRCKELEHFGHFYGYSRNSGADRMHPVPVRFLGVDEDTVTFPCPAMIGFGLDDPTNKIKMIRDQAAEFLKVKPRDIIICPPTTMDQ
jgi:hypothetical protein